MNEDMNTGAGHYTHGALFRVMDAPQMHEAIEQTTGLRPSHSHKVGDVRFKERLWENSIWILESPLPETEQLSAHLRWLWCALAAHQNYLRTLKDAGVKMDLFCKFQADVDTGGFSIEPDALKIATDFGLTLEVSVFFT